MMKRVKRNVARWTMSLMAITLLTLGLAACGGGGGGGTTSSTVPATVMFSGGSAAPVPSSGFVSRVVEACGNVDTDTIDSLFLDITRVEVHHAGSNDDDSDDEEEADDDDSTSLDPDTEDVEAAGWLTVFEAATPADVITVDVKSLQVLSEILTSVNLPEGKFTKIAIYYENPVLTIDDDNDGNVVTPSITTTAVQTTANGRIFISQNFTIDDDDGSVLIQIEFSSICLTDNGTVGAHDYVLNPQLRVDISALSVEAEFEGMITGFTTNPLGLTVDNGEAILDVIVVVTDPADPGDTEFLRELAGDVHEVIAYADLVIGDEVEVEGELQLDGSMLADSVEIEMEEVVVP